MKRKFLILSVVSYFLISFCFCYGVIVSPGIILGADWGFPATTQQVITASKNAFYVWRNEGNLLGYEVLRSTDFLFRVLLEILSTFIPVEIIYKVICVFVIALGGISTYVFSQYLKQREAPSFIAGLFYMSTPFFFNHVVMGWIYALYSYSLLPLALTVFVISIEKRSLMYSLLCGLLYCSASVQLQSLLIYPIVFISYVLFLRPSWKTLRLCGKYLTIPLLIGILTNSNWILTIISSNTELMPPYEFVVEWRSLKFSDINLIRLWGSVFNYQFETAFPSELIFVTFLLPALAYSAIILRARARNDRNVIYFSGLSLLPVILYWNKYIFSWNIPFIVAFRGLERLFLLNSFSYSVLLACLTNILLGNLRSRKTHRFLIVSSMLLIVVLNSYPFWTGELYGTQKAVYDTRLRTFTPPAEYAAVDNWLLSKEGDFKVLWLPGGGGLVFEYDDKFYSPFGEAIDIWAGFSSKPGGISLSYERGTNFERFLLLNAHSGITDHLGRILGLANIEYVIHRMYTSGFDGASATNLLHILSNQKDLVQISSHESMLTQAIVNINHTDNWSIVRGYGSLSLFNSYLKANGTTEDIYGQMWLRHNPIGTWNFTSADFTVLAKIDSPFTRLIFRLEDTNGKGREWRVCYSPYMSYEWRTFFFGGNSDYDQDEGFDVSSVDSVNLIVQHAIRTPLTILLGGIECSHACIQNLSSIKMFQNDAVLPHLRAAEGVLVAGDRSVLIPISQLPNFTFTDYGLFFVEQMEPVRVENINAFSDTLIIENGKWLDLVFSIIPKSCKIFPYLYANKYGLEDGWSDLFRWHWSYNLDYTSSIEDAAITTSLSNLTMPFVIDNEGIHDVWIRSYRSDATGSFDAFIDGRPIGAITPGGEYETGFTWVYINSLNLTSGEHEIVVQSHGENVISQIAVVPTTQLEMAHHEALRISQDKRVIILSRIEDWDVDSQDRSQKKKLLHVFVPKEGNYTLQVLAKRVGDISVQGNPLIQVNGMERPVNSTEFEWLDFGHIHLNRGMEHLIMESHPDIIINEYYLDSNYKVTNSSKPHISFKKINPTEYVIQTESTEPFFLIFSESYHPSWEATAKGLSLDHYVVDSFANAYYIKTKGHCEILLSFTEQRIYEKGIILTLATIIVIFVCFTFFGIIKCLPLIRSIRRKMIWLNK